MIKKHIYRLFILSSIFAFISTVSAKDDFQVEAQPRVIEAAQRLEQHGVLKQKKNGFLYVEVSREFISKVLPLIEAKGKLTPPGHVMTKNGVGPHISVMYDKEVKEHKIGPIRELGQSFAFHVKELRTIKVRKNDKTRKLWIIAVDAPILERLRISYGLSAKLKGHDFHITLAEQTSAAAESKIAAQSTQQGTQQVAAEEKIELVNFDLSESTLGETG